MDTGFCAQLRTFQGMTTAPFPEIDEELLSQIVELVRQGKNREAIAKDLGTSVWAIRDYMKPAKAALGLPSKTRATTLAGIAEASVLDAYEEAVTEATEVTMERDELHEYLVSKGVTPPPAWDAITLKDSYLAEVVDKDGETVERSLDAYWRIRNPESPTGQLVIEEPHPIDVRIQIAAKLPDRKKAAGLRCAFFFPDTQFNYWIDEREQWHTTADEAAIDVAMQILADVEAEHGVNEVIQLGDFLDLPHMSKHRSSPAQVTSHGLNRTTRRASRFLAEVTALTPNARRLLLQGNHDARLVLSLIDSNPLLVGLAVEGDVYQPPLISLERLLGVARNGWDLSRPYPHEQVYLREDWKVTHGPCVKPTVKLTNDQYLQNEEHTTYGHTHRQGITYKTWKKSDGLHTYSAGSPGTLCRTDGAVPSALGAHSDWGTPDLGRGEQWEQGVQVSFYEPEKGGLLQHELVTIRNGRAFWRGRLYEARCDVDGNAL